MATAWVPGLDEVEGGLLATEISGDLAAEGATEAIDADAAEAIANNVTSKQFNPAQRQIIKDAKAAAKHGLPEDEANDLWVAARDAGLKGHGPTTHEDLGTSNKWYGVRHIKVNRTHIRIVND